MSLTGPDDATSTGSRQVIDADQISRACARMAHEVLEANRGATGLVLLGIPTRGVAAGRTARPGDGRGGGARRSRSAPLDVTMYRDDLRRHPTRAPGRTDVPVSVDGAVVVLVDDVLFSGRTVRAALDALGDLGRPRAVRLAVLVDRGHRELPVRADHVGKNLPTRLGRTRVGPAERGRRDRRGHHHPRRTGGTLMRHLLSAADLGAAEVGDLLDLARRWPSSRAARSRSCPRCAAGPWSTCSSRTPPAPAARSSWPASGCPPT